VHQILKAIHLTACLAALTGCAASTAAQTPAAAPTAAQATVADQGQATPAGYLIGPDDVLGIVFWELPNHGGDVIVRPDGKITLPLLNDVQAAGLTPEQLRESITAASAKYIRDPNVSVVVKQINSLKVYVTGQVTKPGTYPLTSPTTVLQVLALAGGVTDFAKKDKIVVMRTEGGQTRSYKFNYKDVIQGKKLEQNILLKPGDTVVIP
jgi:polysaccharide export outer membrane protein